MPTGGSSSNISAAGRSIVSERAAGWKKAGQQPLLRNPPTLRVANNFDAIITHELTNLSSVGRHYPPMLALLAAAPPPLSRGPTTSRAAVSAVRMMPYRDEMGTPWKPASWEQESVSSFDYSAWSKSLRETMVGIDSVRQCLRNTKKVLPLLKEITTRDYFSFFAVNLITPCSYFPSEEAGCEIDRCEIEATFDRDIPPELLKRDMSEYDFAIDGWCRKDMPSDFTEYFDLRKCPSRDTGYDGSRVWQFIHNKICFRKQLRDPQNSWKRDYNRAVSGMHATVHAEIVADLGLTEEGRDEYRRRLRDEPGAITNLYFVYMLTLCALHDSSARLNSESYLGDAVVKPLMQELTQAELLANPAVQRAALNLRSHAGSHATEVWRMRMRTRDLKAIMGCVQCNLCRVHGTVMALGFGATLQVLLGSDGRGGDPLDLDRVQLAALVVTAEKFGRACETVERFRDFDGEQYSQVTRTYAELESDNAALVAEVVRLKAQLTVCSVSGVVAATSAEGQDAKDGAPGGKGFGGGEATRDPEPTAYDPNDPKGKQQAIHKAESFTEYLAKREAAS